MEAKELRIGNLVLQDLRRITTVAEIGKENIWCLFETHGEGKIPLSNIKPIPLTEEWLLRFGFSKDELGLFYFDYKSQCFLNR